MGTRGLYVFFHKGNYYVFYNHMDSYPEALGQVLVMMVKLEDVSKWGAVIEDQIDHGNYKIRRFETNDMFELKEVKANEGDKELMNDDEWAKTMYDESHKRIVLLKWNHNKLITSCKLLKYTVSHGCPTMERSGFLFKTQDWAQVQQAMEEWTYVIDLDNKMFRVIGGVNTLEFGLNEIPFDWIDQINGPTEQA